VGALLAFALAPCVGRWSDSVGRRPVLLGTTMLMLFTPWSLLLHSYWNWSFYWFYAADFLARLGMSPGLAANLSYLADVTAPFARPTAFAYVMGTFSITQVIGPFISQHVEEVRACMCPLFCSVPLWW
jgi:MFS family permease